MSDTPQVTNGIKSYPLADALRMEAFMEAIPLVTHGIELQAIKSKAKEIYLTKIYGASANG